MTRPDAHEIAQLEADYDRWNIARCNRAADALHTTPDGHTCGHSDTYPSVDSPCPTCGSVGLTRTQLAEDHVTNTVTAAAAYERWRNPDDPHMPVTRDGRELTKDDWRD